MKTSLHNFFLHLVVFIAIELIFIFLLFRELPETNLISLIGVLHTTYWIVLLGAGWLREQAQKVRKRALYTYFPVLYHVFIHIYAGRAAVDMHQGHIGHMHDEHEMIWIITGAILLGILIFIGEYLLHRKIHCDSHHIAAHVACHDASCETHHGDKEIVKK